MRVAEAAAAAVGVRDGPTYTQVLVGPDGPRVGELAARLGGGHDAELCDAAVGVDLNQLAIAAALGERIYEGGLVPDELAGGACVRFLVPEPGVLEAVEGLDGAARSSGVVWARSYREPGHEFGPLPPRRRPRRRRARRRRLAQEGRRPRAPRGCAHPLRHRRSGSARLASRPAFPVGDRAHVLELVVPGGA